MIYYLYIKDFCFINFVFSLASIDLNLITKQSRKVNQVKLRKKMKEGSNVLNANINMNSSKNVKALNNHVAKIMPVQMIKFDQDKNVIITDQAIEIFNKMTSQELHIITVAGKYRTGKSYILNRVLLEQNQGFQVGPTINACTKGLWMWPQLIKIVSNGKQKDCLIVDTEGLGSLQQGQNTDLKIFLMATLISSYLIYNSVGSIDEKAIESLNLVVNLANAMQKENSSYDCQQLINSFPSFMWLVRDFSLKLQNVIGEEITSQEYLQNALKQQKGNSKIIQKKNEVRKQLKTFFKERDCFTLIRPTLSQVDLQNLSLVPQKKLRPEFVRMVSELKSRIHNSLRPKKIRGKSISPQGFVELCNYYIKTINSGKLPSISSHWDNLCFSESSRLINKYRLIHKEKLLQIQGSSKDKIEQKTIQKLHNQILNEGKQYIQKSFLGKLQRQLSKQKLDKLLTQNFAYVLSRIRAQSSNNTQIQVQILKLFQSFEKIQQFQTKQQIIQTIQNAYEQFQRLQQLNKQQNSHIYKYFYLSNKQAISKALYFLQNLYENKFFTCQNKINSLSARIKSLQEQKLSQIQSFEQKITIKQRKIEQIQSANKKLTMKLQNKLIQFQQLSTKYQNTILQQQKKSQQETKTTIQEFQTEINKLKDVNQKNQKSLQFLQNQKNKNQIILFSTNFTLKQVSLNLRKTTREYEVIKNKLLQYQKENAILYQENQKMKTIIPSLESSLRKNKHLSNTKFGKQNSVEFYINSNQQAQLKKMCYKIEQLQLTNRQYKIQKQNLQKVVQDQKQINRILMQAPHNMNYLSLKKNYQFQKDQILKLKEIVQKYQKAISHMSGFQCILCKQLQKNSLIFEHYQVCSNRWSIDFDISYQIDGDHQIWFIFQIAVQQKVFLKRQSKQKTSQVQLHKWQIRKNINNIKLLMKKINRKSELFQTKDFFQNQQNNCNSSSIIMSLKNAYQQIQTQTIQEDQDVNLNQQRRLYIDQLCSQIRGEIFSNQFLIQFFGFDIHLILANNTKKIKSREKYDKKNQKKNDIENEASQNEQMLYQQQQSNGLYLHLHKSPSNNYSIKQSNNQLYQNKQTKKKKIQKKYRSINIKDLKGLKYLDQIQQENQCQWNNSNIVSNLRSSSENVNFLKTTKFTKKSFNFSKFGPNMI